MMHSEARLAQPARDVAVGTAPRTSAANVGLTLVRLTLGALFVSVFFENKGKGLYTPGGYAGLITGYIHNGHAPAAWKSIMLFAATNARWTAPLQAVTEISFGILLILGLLTRPVAFGAFLFLTSLWVSELGTAWIWELLVPMMAALAVAIGGGGRWLGLDGTVRRRVRSAVDRGDGLARLIHALT